MDAECWCCLDSDGVSFEAMLLPRRRPPRLIASVPPVLWARAGMPGLAPPTAAQQRPARIVEPRFKTPVRQQPWPMHLHTDDAEVANGFHPEE